MTVDEVLILKKKAENEIKQILSLLQDSTGMYVDGIEFIRTQESGFGDVPITIDEKVVLKLNI